MGGGGQALGFRSPRRPIRRLEAPVFSELWRIVRNKEIEAKLAADFDRMFTDAAALVVEGGQYFWGKEVTHEGRLGLYGKAETVADLHRYIRNLVIVHSPLSTSTDRAYFLGIINLIREVERLVERAKNLVEMARIRQAPLEDDDLVRELRQIRRSIEDMLGDVPSVLRESDVVRAQKLDELGRENIRRLDSVTERAARSPYTADHAISVGLGATTYARIQRQLLNIMSSLVTPLHLVDFYEERQADGPPESGY